MALPSAIPAPVAQVAGAKLGREWITEVKNQRKPKNKNHVWVDVECVYCDFRDKAELPIPLADYIECPECGRTSRLDLAIIEYLGESE